MTSEGLFQVRWRKTLQLIRTLVVFELILKAFKGGAHIVTLRVFTTSWRNVDIDHIELSLSLYAGGPLQIVPECSLRSEGRTMLRVNRNIG